MSKLTGGDGTNHTSPLSEQVSYSKEVLDMAQTGPQNLAIAGAKDNNCLLNCFTHSLFSLPANQLQLIAQTETFKDLIREFENYYSLEDITVEDLMNLHALLDSPYDHEIIWGDVLRKHMEKLSNLTVQERAALKDNKELPESIMIKFAKHMRVNLTIHNSYDNIQAPTVQVVDNSFFSMELYHSQQGGGHYDFIFPDDPTGAKAKAHNEAFEDVEVKTIVEEETVTERLKKPIRSHLYDASMTTGKVAREAAVKNAVALYMQGIIDERIKDVKPKPITHLATMVTSQQPKTVKEPSAVLVARQRPKPKAEIVPTDDTDSPLKSASEGAEPMVGVRFDTPLRDLQQQQQQRAEELEDTYQLRAKKHAKKPKDGSTDKKEAPKILIDEATGFPKAFIERLPVLFPAQDWDRDLKKDNLGIKHKTDGRNIQITQDPQKEEVIFKSSGKGGVKDMLKCAKAYEEATSVEYILEYELKASSPEQAKKFMEKMKENGLNVHQLKEITIQGKKLEPGKLEALIEEVMPRPKTTPKPSFGGQSSTQ